MFNKNKLFENVTALYSVQFVNVVLPLMAFPYLVRILGTERFGLLTFAAAFIQYFVTFTDYGFNYSATRSISIHREDPNAVSLIFCSVELVKILIMIISYIVLFLLIFYIPRFRNDWLLYLITSLAILGNVLFPVYLFQGIEKMKLLALCNMVAKVISVALIFIFIRSTDDYLLAAILQTSGVLIAGIISLLTIKHVYPQIRIVIPKTRDLIEISREGWNIFIAVLSTTMFASSNIFILGLFSNNLMVGYFSIADKIVRAIINLSNPISNAIYPRTGALFFESKEKAVLFLKKVILFSSPIFMSASILLFIFADIIVKIITGSHNEYIVLLIKILSILPFTVYLDNFYGVQILFNTGRSRELMKIILCAGTFSVITSLIMVPFYKAIATSVILLSTELIILIWTITKARNAEIYLIYKPIL